MVASQVVEDGIEFVNDGREPGECLKCEDTIIDNFLSELCVVHVVCLPNPNGNSCKPYGH